MEKDKLLYIDGGVDRYPWSVKTENQVPGACSWFGLGSLGQEEEVDLDAASSS